MRLFSDFSEFSKQQTKQHRTMKNKTAQLYGAFGSLPKKALVLGEHLGLYHGVSQAINIYLGTNGCPMPMCVLDADGTVLDTALSFHIAARRLVEMNRGNISCVPSLDHFKRGVNPNIYSWGVPSSISEDDAWNMLRDITLELERKNPSKLFPGVDVALRMINSHSQIIVLTFNALHPIAEMVKEQAGVSVDVVIVGKDKTAALNELAKHHNEYHGKTQKPLYFFGDSPGDMSAAKRCEHPVTPVGVIPNIMLEDRNRVHKINWRKKMVENGAKGIIRHHNLGPAASGLVDLDHSLKERSKML